MDSEKPRAGWLALECVRGLKLSVYKEGRCIVLLFAFSCGNFGKYNISFWRSLQKLNKPWTSSGLWYGFLSTTAVYLAQSYVAHIIFMWLSQDTLYISHDERSRCAPRVDKCVRPLPSAGFPRAGALEPASLPSWNKSLRHSHGASASWSREHTWPAVHVQPCPTYERCQSAWMRGERNEHTQREGEGRWTLTWGSAVSNYAHNPKKNTNQSGSLSWIRFRLKSPDSVQLQCLLCWPTGSPTGGLQHDDNRSDGVSGEFRYDHQTLAYQFACFSAARTHRPHSHYARMS